MRCEEFQELMQREVDGLLSSADAARLEAHLASCAFCRRELELLRGVDAALREESLVEAPSGLVPATMALIAEREARRRMTERVVLWGAGATAGGFAVASLVRAVRNADVGERFTTAVNRTLTALPQPPLPDVETPGLIQRAMENPGVLGVLWTLAVVGAAFLAVVLLRASRQLSLEWR